MEKDLLKINKDLKIEVEAMLNDSKIEGKKEAVEGCERLLKIVDNKVKKLNFL